MSLKIIEQQLQKYLPETKRDELNALKEIAQEIALYALSRSDFFKHAGFQGGSCLRIIHGLNRFSEDLDFIALHPNKDFSWEPYLQIIKDEFILYGLSIDVIDRSKLDRGIKLAFLKDSSFGKVLVLKHPRSAQDKQNILIKLEIDTNPPMGSHFETHFLTFPTTYSLLTQDLPSLFAGKCHALLCRPFVKGRDWYDFIWYTAQRVIPNFKHLQLALEQTGPWSGQHLAIDATWLLSELATKIKSIDWSEAQRDAAFFLSKNQQEQLMLWSTDFFLSFLKKFQSYLITSSSP